MYKTFWSECPNIRQGMEALDLDGRMTLKWMTRRSDGVVGSGVVWPCTGKIVGRGLENTVMSIRVP
jgi:hypothetical protein